MNTRSFIRLTLVLGAVAAGIAAGVSFARRMSDALCYADAVAQVEESAAGEPQPVPEADGRKPAPTAG